MRTQKNPPERSVCSGGRDPENWATGSACVFLRSLPLTSLRHYRPAGHSGPGAGRAELSDIKMRHQISLVSGSLVEDHLHKRARGYACSPGVSTNNLRPHDFVHTVRMRRAWLASSGWPFPRRFGSNKVVRPVAGLRRPPEASLDGDRYFATAKRSLARIEH